MNRSNEPPAFARANNCHSENSIHNQQPTRYDVSVRVRLVASLIPVVAGIARGGVVRLEINPVPADQRDANLPASYEMLRGKAYGELDPKDRRNAIIQDIELAPRNSRGEVEYVATFTLYRPVARAKSSGVLLYEVVNRGAALTLHDYATGDIFLQSGWQGDIPFGGKAINGSHSETIQVPIARNPDGTPLTGPVLAGFANVCPGPIRYPVEPARASASSGVPPLPATDKYAAEYAEDAQLRSPRHRCRRGDHSARGLGLGGL